MGEGPVIGFGVMGLLVAGIAWLWNRVSLDELSYERRLSQQRAFIGEEVGLTVALTNKKPVPLGRVEVEDEVPDALVLRDAPVITSVLPNSQVLRHSTSMAWYERIRWDYRFTCSHRGYYRIGPSRMESGDLFGFFSSQKTQTGDDYLLVYPRVVPLPELGLPAVRPLGETGGGLRLFQDPSRPYGVRDYQPGDPLNTVDWKASARMQGLQVRTYEPSSTTTIVVTLVVETSEQPWGGYSSANLERVVTVGASVASHAAEQRYSLGLFANGAHILADRPMNIPPTRSPEQLTIILEALATINPMAIGPVAPQLAEHSRRLPIGATLAIVTAVMPPELAEVIGGLKVRGFRAMVLYVGDGPSPSLPEGIVVHNLRAHLDTLEAADEFGPR